VTATIVRPDLGEFRDQWDDLVLRTPPPSPMLRSWWIETAEATQRSFVLVARDGQLLGGLAVDVDHRWRRLPILRSESGSTYQDILVRPGHGREVVDRVRHWFRSHRHAIVDIAGVLPGSRLRDALPTEVQELPFASSPYISIPAGFDTYLAERTKNWRSSYRRHRRRLEQEGCVYRRLERRELDRGLEELRRLHAAIFPEDSWFLPEFEEFRAVARAGSDAGEFALHALEMDGRIVAIDALVELGPYVYSLQTGRDPSPEYRGAGTVLLARAIEDYCQREARELDLYVGEFPYKLRLTDQTRQVVRLHGAWGWAGNLAVDADRARARLRAATARPRRWVGWKIDGVRERLGRVGRP
jgi:CelD/BcsL family acetyltransferase involved in cellulose biosynthesis